MNRMEKPGRNKDNETDWKKWRKMNKLFDMNWKEIGWKKGRKTKKIWEK